MWPASVEDGWFSLARGDFCGGCHTCWVGGGGRRKSQNRKIVLLPPYVKEPLNSKVIKSFVPERRSRYVFLEFRDSYVRCYIYIYIYIYIYMNICNNRSDVKRCNVREFPIRKENEQLIFFFFFVDGDIPFAFKLKKKICHWD